MRHFGAGTSPALLLYMMLASYEVCLLTSPVQTVMHKLRQMVSPLYRLHHNTLDCVELHYSDERDAMLLRLCFSEFHLGRDRQRELVQCLAESGFEVLESSEIAPREKPRFETLLREQYGMRVQQYPSAESPSVVSKILDSLEAHLEAAAAPEPELPKPVRIAVPKGVRRLATIDALDHIIDEIPMFEVDVEGSKDAIEIGAADDRAATVLEVEEVDTLPVRLETFGPLDGMIAKLPRAKTQESLDAILDKLWP